MLKRDISRTNILIAAAGGMIGSGWLFSPFISAHIAGPYALISWIVAAVFMIFVALPLCELGSMFPISGGMANYPSFTHGSLVGFLFAWTAWLSYVVITPIEIQAVLQYSSYFFPRLVVKTTSGIVLSSFGYLYAFTLTLAIVLMNSFGIKLLAECNKFASLIKFILPLTATVALLSIAPSFENIQLHGLNKTHWENIFSALSTGGVIFAFTGFQNGLMLAGEVKNPQTNIPIAILGAIMIGFVIYFLLQLGFLAAIPAQYLHEGWAQVHFPGDSAPLVGLTLLLGLNLIAWLLLFDAAFSPLGTAMVYTAATARITYGMALNQYLPAYLRKENRYRIPYVALLVNAVIGLFSFLPFPGWQKMVAFLSSCCVLSYGIGPICLVAMRTLQPNRTRPFYLRQGILVSYLSFYVCNLMLYWCGFEVLWKLSLALGVGLALHLVYQREPLKKTSKAFYWFFSYILCIDMISYWGIFGGIGRLAFPYDLMLLLPVSCFFLYTSTRVLLDATNHQKAMKGLATSELPGNT